MQVIVPNAPFTKWVNDRKVAFMMAWNTRLGQNSLISKYIPKDVAKLIVNQYIIVADQLILFKKRKVLTRKVDFVIGIDGIDNNVMMRNPNRDVIKLIPIAFIDKSLTEFRQITVQTPLLVLPFGTDAMHSPDRDTDKPRGFSTQIVDTDKSQWFIDWLNEIDNNILESLKKRSSSKEKIHDEFYTRAVKASFEKDAKDGLPIRNKYPPLFNVRIHNNSWDKIRVFDKDENDMGTLATVWDKGVFGKKAEIRLVIKHIGVWQSSNNRFSNQWVVEQVMVHKSALDIAKEGLACLFTNIDDNE